MPSATADDTSRRPNEVRGAATFPVNGVNGSKRTVSNGSSSNGSQHDLSDSSGNDGVLDGSRPTPSLQTTGLYEYDGAFPKTPASARLKAWGDDPKSAAFPRISKPGELMRSSYDCVVIGSGYGGGVAASRMARARESVCVLERGKERWPGEYPKDTSDALEQVHYSGQFAPGWLPAKAVKGGDPTGMYHLICGNGQNAVVGNGQSSCWESLVHCTDIPRLQVSAVPA